MTGKTETIRDLISRFNATNPEKPLKSWKKSKAILETMVKDREAEVAEQSIDTAPVPENSEDTIRGRALELLGHIAYYEDRTQKSSPENVVDENDKNARSVGLGYDEILRRIHDEFPDCQTSNACLRWYAVKVRAGEIGYEENTLPQRRPRAKPSKG